MLSLPIWMYLIFVGILFSGFMTIKTAKEDSKVDNEFIEKEGEVYIKRMEEEKQQRKKTQAIQ